jgi:hypothetical protein
VARLNRSVRGQVRIAGKLQRNYERPYYLVPDRKSEEEAFAVIRDAMRDKGRVALCLCGNATSHAHCGVQSFPKAAAFSFCSPL